MYSTLVLALSLFGSSFAAPQYGCPQASSQSALYFMTNEPSGNEIVSLPISSNGSVLVENAVKTSTGGIGAVGMNAMGPAGPDAFFSQGAVAVGDDYLFAVNAGSNTVSMFHINPQNPSELTLVGQPQDTKGEFPVSVAYSSKLNTACVVNGGAINGISCFSVDASCGLQAADSLRSFDLTQTTPPMGPPNTVSHVFFNPDSTALMATVKSDGTTNGTNPGFFASFPIEGNKVSTSIVKSTPAGSATLFGTVFTDENTAIAADPSFGAVILKLGSDFQATSEFNVGINNGTTAPCWTAYSSKTKTVFIGDAGANAVLQIDPVSGTIVEPVLNLKANHTGLFDSIAHGDSFYGLLPMKDGVAIAAVDLSMGAENIKESGNFIVSGAGLNSMGLAAYPAEKM